MKILSLFDGMSVAQQALKDAGIPVAVYYASEIDEYAKSVTQSNFPDTKQVGSVVGLNGEFFHNIDLLIGGSPCQDLSIAKANRKGLGGSRSGLFWEYVRIRDEVKPKYFILENVFSMPKEAKEVISETLGVQPIMINASLVSAQNRKRLFWVGKLDEFGTYKQVEISQPEDRGILLKDIIEENICEDFILKNGKTNQYSSNQPNKYESQKAKTLLVGGDTPSIIGVASRTYPRTKIEGVKRRKQIEIRDDEKANAMTSVQADSMVMQDTQIRKLTPTECLRLQSMPDDYFDKALYKNKSISNTQRYKMCGNAFNKEVIVHILKYLK